MKIVNGRVNRTRLWPLKVILGACAAGFVASIPFEIAQRLSSTDAPVDMASVAIGLTIPPLVGFVFGRFWLVSFAFWGLVYGQDLASSEFAWQDLSLGFMVATLLAGTMSFLVDRLKLRTWNDPPKALEPNEAGVPSSP